MNRFVVEEQWQETACGCPGHLCKHSDGIRRYRAWTVRDTVAGTHGTATTDKREAQATALAANKEAKRSALEDD